MIFGVLVVKFTLYFLKTFKADNEVLQAQLTIMPLNLVVCY